MIGYKEAYYKWQKKLGELGGTYDTLKYIPYIKKGFTVLDFGCGGGFILEALKLEKGFGVEPNDTARFECELKGLKVSSTIDSYKQESFDLIYSNHVFEHLDSPLETAINLRSYLKKEGILIVTVPNECNVKYVENNIDQHLYTWSEINLGNLLYKAGYQIIEVKTIRFRWTPRFTWIHSFFGFHIFKIFCYLNSFVHNDRKEIMAIAKK